LKKYSDIFSKRRIFLRIAFQIFALLLIASFAFCGEELFMREKMEKTANPDIYARSENPEFSDNKTTLAKKEVASDAYPKPFPKIEPKVLKRMNVTASAYYSPVPGQKKYHTGSYKGDMRLNGGGLTFSETMPKKGRTVAADIEILPLGSRIRIAGSSVIFEVEDTGKSIKGKRIDLFMGKGDEALKESLDFGIRKIEIEIIHLAKK